MTKDQYIQLYKEECKDNYYFFFKEFWETVVSAPLVDNWHIKYLCDELQKVGARVLKGEDKAYDLIINISPGESKSTIATILFPVWLWVNDSSLRNISSSYSLSLSIDHAMLSRDCIKSEKFQALFGDEVQIRKDVDQKSVYWTLKGGYRFTTSTTSSVVGKHASGVIIIDDPLSPQQASSEAEIKAANRFVNKTLPSRKTNKTVVPTILIMQRLHEDDPTGSWTKQMEAGRKIKHICLPASDEYEIKPATDIVEWSPIEGEPPLRKTIKEWYAWGGGYMNPNRTGEQQLAEQKIALGAHEYAGQYGQNPQPTEGNLIKRWHLPIVGFSDVPPDFWIARKIASGDLAQTAKEENDPNGILIFKVIENELYLIDFQKYHEAFKESKSRILNILDKHEQEGERPAIYIENKSAGLDMVDSLDKNNGINAIPFKVGAKDKTARVRSVLDYFRAGRVKIVKGAWDYQGFIDQLLVFPNGKHDEEVDCVVMAIFAGLKQVNTASTTRSVKTYNF